MFQTRTKHLPSPALPEPPDYSTHGLWHTGANPLDSAVYYGDAEIALTLNRAQAENMVAKLNNAEALANTIWLHDAVTLAAFDRLINARLAFNDAGRVVPIGVINEYHDAWAQAFKTYAECKRVALGLDEADLVEVG